MREQLTGTETAVILEIVGTIDPDELPLARDLLAPPKRFRLRAGSAGSPVDFGGDVDLNLITPAATALVLWAYSVAKGEVQPVAEERLRTIFRKVFRLEQLPSPPPRPEVPTGRSTDAKIALDCLEPDLARWATALEVDPHKASVLAELVVQRLKEMPENDGR